MKHSKTSVVLGLVGAAFFLALVTAEASPRGRPLSFTKKDNPRFAVDPTILNLDAGGTSGVFPVQFTFSIVEQTAVGPVTRQCTVSGSIPFHILRDAAANGFDYKGEIVLTGTEVLNLNTSRLRAKFPQAQGPCRIRGEFLLNVKDDSFTKASGTFQFKLESDTWNLDRLPVNDATEVKVDLVGVIITPLNY